MELEHFLHKHPLVLSDESFMVELKCNMCGDPINGLTYGCKQCIFVLHKLCAELPEKMHDPEHPEHALDFCNYSVEQGGDCAYCGSAITSHPNFQCFFCDWPLHIQCAALLLGEDELKINGIEYSLVPEFQPHGVQGEEEGSSQANNSPPCEACRHPCSFPRIESCNHQSYLHIQCALLPRTKNHPCHRHSFKLVAAAEAEDPGSDPDELYCDICEKERQKGGWIYYCADCNLVGHLTCTNTEVRPPANVFHGGDDPLYFLARLLSAQNLGLIGRKSSQDKEKENNQNQDSEKVDLEELFSKRYMERIQEIEEGRVYEIDHFMHPHPLRLYNEPNMDKATFWYSCHGCVRHVSGLTYICEQCNFYIHKDCAELPQQIQHPKHEEHPVFLMPQKLHNGERTGYLLYSCDLCDFHLPLVLALDNDRYKHESHEHPLTINLHNPYYGIIKEENNLPHCNACSERCMCFALECSRCNFHLHIGCATAEPSIKFDCHRHPLFLTYSLEEDDSEEYYCDVCEMARVPNCWVYHCAKCNYVVHLNCENLPALDVTALRI